MTPARKFIRNNGLSLTLASLFVFFWAAQAVCGWMSQNETQAMHGGATQGFVRYLCSGHFWQATGENWESEFLQMGAYVILTSFLFQKGSAESRDPDEPEVAKPGATRGTRSFLFRYSLSLAFFALFLFSFAIHARGAFADSNRQRAEHGLRSQEWAEFMGSPEFWFQSFQNWQSEFLAVIAIVVLSIFLRQEGSPESKDVNAPNSKTGK